MADNQQPGLVANILAVAGFFILIVIIVWGAYHLLRLTGSGLSSLFSRWGDNAIEITVPATPVQSGRTFTLSWDHTPSDEGTYAFLYQCNTGFRFDTSIAGTPTQIPCGGAYTVSGTSLALTPQLTSTSSVEIPLSIVYMSSATSTPDAERPQGNAVITITPGPSMPPASTGSQTNTGSGSTAGGTPAPRPTAPGVPDLTVQILATGVIDAYGNFVARQPVSADEVTAVKFDIKNSGTASTGAWYFTVKLPMHNQGGTGQYLYASPAQMNLTPGSRIENVLRFKPIQNGGGPITITIDSTNVVRESNENNNILTQYMTAPTWTNYYYQAPQVF